jgi:subtilisin-like proprotein convertase family protein
MTTPNIPNAEIALGVFNSRSAVWRALLPASPRFRAISAPLLLALGCTIGWNSAQGATIQSFSYTGPAVFIPDAADLTGNNPGASAFASLVVSGFGPTEVITDINFKFDGTVTSVAGSTAVGLSHTFAHDLEVSLIAPNSTSVLMLDNIDGSGNNFAQMILDDSAVTSVSALVSSQAPFNGTWKPSNPLSVFDGLQPNGTWQLRAQDFFSGDTGNIRLFTGTITADTAAVPEPSTTLLLLSGIGLLCRRRR